MRYFYVKFADKVALIADGRREWTNVPNLEDPSIVPGSIEEFTRYTGWLEVTPDANPEVPACSQ